MIELKGISVEDFAHPEEKAAIAALKKVKVLEKVLNWVASEETRYLLKTEILGNYFGITEKDYPSLYKIVKEVCQVLDYPQTPRLYLYRSPDMEISVLAGKEPVLIFPDFIVRDYDDEMLRFEIGCAITALKSKNNQLKMAAMTVGSAGTAIPFVGEALIPVLANWSRKAIYTEDRGGLLACQDFNMAIKTLMRIAGLPKNYIDTSLVHEYIKEYNSFHTLADKSQYVQTIVRMKPWTNDRIVELYKWYHSGQYDDLLEDY